MPIFQGTYTALVTPFRDGQVDHAALEKHVEAQIAAGVDGLVPCGTTGESPTLTAAEHDAVVECVIRTANKRVTVLAGTGANSTAVAVEKSRRAAEAGADGLLLVAPYYNKPTQQGLFEHYSAIAREVPLPQMVYNIPGRCGVEISIETIKRLREAHDNIAAVKHATGSVEGAADLMQACDIAVMSGDDPVTLPLMSIGAVGVVSVVSNLLPRSVKRLTDAGLAGDWAAARAAHDALYRFSRAMLSLATNPIPIKTALAIRGVCGEEFRLPICPLEPEERDVLVGLLADCKLD